MAKITTVGPKPISPVTSNLTVASGTVAKRSMVDLLPGVNKTEALTKFFSATVDHLFQPENVEFITGYIGSKPAYYSSSKDFYVPEIDITRTNYQLPITAVSVDLSSNATTNVMFYDDILNQLKLQGANVENADRLLEGDYYSWLPPIDPDKFVNYYEYYWLPDGPGIIELLDATNIDQDIIGKKTYTYTGRYIRYSDNKEVKGTLVFSTGMRFTFVADINPVYNGRRLVVDGVGRAISLEDDVQFPNPSWDTTGWDLRRWNGDESVTIPDYMTIARFSVSRNRWSVNNRWFHKDVLIASGISVNEQQNSKALRPIIEFDKDIELYNFGTYGRGDVDLIDTARSDFFKDVAGKPTAEVDGTELLDGMRVLVTADSDADVNNRVYEISGIKDLGLITLTPVYDGQNTDGSPAYGDSIYVRFGITSGDVTLWYNGYKWITAQKKVKYQPPLFAGYDKDSNNLIDPAIYPGSNFTGTTIFTYELDSNATVDPILNIQIKRDQFGDYVFDNSLATKSYTYIENGLSANIYGYIWYKNNDIANGWHKCANHTRQYKVNSFDIVTDTGIFLIDQIPDARQADQLPTVIVYFINNGNSTPLIEGVDYTITGRLVTLTNPIAAGTRLEVWSYSSGLSSGSNGYYLLPTNLISNANNDQPTSISYNQTIEQFSGIISNQLTTVGMGMGVTAWRDSEQVISLGTKILQHRSPLLKLMLLNSTNLNTGILSSNAITDPSLSIQFAQKEYVRFYNRFIRSLFTLYSAQGYGKNITPQQWVTAALTQINIGKSKASAWAYSGYEQSQDFSSTTGNPTFVPPTAARLGVAPVYKPTVYLNTDYYPPKITIQTHDGARVVMEELDGTPLGTVDQGKTVTSNPELLTHPVAAAWLQFELNLYNGMPAYYRDPDTVLAFDLRLYRPGKWRTTDYSRQEFIEVQRASFDKWIIQNQVDFRANVGYEQNNQFSFNYSKCVDKQGQSVPGNWRGIYRYFYDTDRPHTHPWEMLGFGQKPTWWDQEYGVAPYTRGNTHMWEDLRDGLIRSGERAGIHIEWARSGLLDCIPVNDQGELLPPILAGTVVSLPSTIDARDEWEFGDGAPIENVWLNSIDHGYVTAITSYLLKPARFIEQGWDPLRTAYAGNQYLYIDTNRRRGSKEFYVHRENPVTIGNSVSVPTESSLTFFGSWGIQHWISEYLTSQNLSVTKYFGDVIRGSQCKLAHKFGGFIGTDDTLRITVDSFGQIGYSSQLIPSENIQTYLYKSTSVGSFFYSGVIIVKQRNGWKVYGYDGVGQKFTIIPSNTTGPKNNIVIGNQSVTDYQTGSGLQYITYGTVFETKQDVYDFLISYGRWLENQGWVFDTVNPDSGKLINWKQSARDFVYWSQGNWDTGNFIALSPAASSAKFKREFGSIQYVNGTISGTYPVLDKTGQPIEHQNLEVLRQDSEILIRTLNDQTVFGLRLFVSSIEHVVLIDNVTQFNDLIYDPLYTVYQPRVKVYAYKTNGWTGRLDAPGYLLYQNPTTNEWEMISNFDKTAEDFRRIYNIDQPKNILKIDTTTGQLVNTSSANYAVTRDDLGDLAKHTIGYQPRNYLQNLLLDDTTQFEFYQGFIRQKGAKRALSNLLRSTNVLNLGGSINYYEEFAFRKARYGSVSLNCNIDFIVDQAELANNPQRIDVFSRYDSNQKSDSAIHITARDPRIVVPPESYEGKLFPIIQPGRLSLYSTLPTAGYVQLGETDYYVNNDTALKDLSGNLITAGGEIKVGDTIWEFITPDGSWSVWKVVEPTSTVLGTTVQVDSSATTINFEGKHGIVNGDIVVTSGFTANDTMNGTFVVQDVTGNTIDIPTATFIAETEGNVKVYRSTRYYSKTDLTSRPILSGWKEGDIAYVDNDGTGSWCVYKWHMNSWEPIRKDQPRVNSDLMLQAKLYSKTSYKVFDNLDYFDPIKNKVPGLADKEITFKSPYDPAQYNKGDETVYEINADSAWAKSHVGEVWWDLSTTRYIDYDQGPLEYKAANWGKLAPGTTLDIYEWVRSPISPSDWAIFASSNVSLSQYGIDYVPTGFVRNADNPVWTETKEYDSNGLERTWYYFWVGHSDLPPSVPERSLTTNEIINVLLNPESNNLAWYAGIGERNLIVANIKNYLKDDDTVLQIVYTNKQNDDNDYKEWALIRKDDPFSVIDEYFWTKLRDSLTGYDGMGNCVPDPRLNELSRYGNLIRPRQSWFKDRETALSIFVSKLNTQLLSATTPLVEDPDKSDWFSYFTQSEPIPDPEGNYEYSAIDMSDLAAIAARALDGQRVLVQPVASNNNLWTIWTWHEDSSEWLLTRKQSYRVENYWSYVDWYLTGYSVETIPTYTVATLNDLSDVTLGSSETVLVKDYGSKGWALYGIVDGVQQIVGLQDGTIQVSDALWDSNVNLYGYDRLAFDSVPFDYNPTIEIGIVFDGIREGLYKNGNGAELNQLFFSMVNYAFSEQNFVDWVFKTSYMTVSGSSEPLSTSQLYKPNIVDNLLDYINEIKPYRSKIREFISGRSTEDTARINMQDFDRPPYDGRILDGNIALDANILATDSTYTPWLHNYLANPNLIRRIKTQLVFDRVSSIPQPTFVINADSFGSTVRFTLESPDAGNTFTVGETIVVNNVFAYGSSLTNFSSADVKIKYAEGNVVVGQYTSNIGIGTGVGGVIFHQSYGAANRILRDYKPTQYMEPFNSPDLISGTDFKGIVYNGLDLNMAPGWGVAPWDFAAGWDADPTAFDSYLEIMLEGGMPPEYETFYGNGTRTKFRLAKVPQDLEHLRIWKDGVLTTYNDDWYIPNWAEGIEIVNPGTGYNLGDVIELIPNNPTTGKNPEVTVIAVSPTGGIVQVLIESKGHYDLVQHDPYKTGYAGYSTGAGTGAILQPIWGGDMVVFVTAPQNTDRPNVYILYAGTTFNPAPDGQYDVVTDGGDYIQPTVEQDHAEELYTAKIRDAMVFDTYTEPVGGMPTIVSKTYITDGVIDHFDLGIRPQNEAAVMAVLDGSLLHYGAFNDYVINFETGTLVFILPPAAGLILNTTAIGEGGSGNSVSVAQVITPGVGYAIGDTIDLEGGVAVETTPSVFNRASVTVTNLTVGNITVTSGGLSYKPGDLLVLDNAGLTDADVLAKVTLRVDTVNRQTGQIQTVKVISAGNYKQIPPTITWKTPGKGTGAAITIDWGIHSVGVINAGLYVRKPTSFTQYAGSSTLGTGATFNVLWTSIIRQETFIADGVTSVFTLDIVPGNANQLMVTSNGMLINPIDIIVDSNNVIIPTPDYGAFVVITVFNTEQYSTVIESVITATVNEFGDMIYNYTVPRSSASSVPNYQNMVVAVNGKIYDPPYVDTEVASGYTRQFELNFVLSDPSYLTVLVDGVVQIEGVDYTLVGTDITFNYTPAEDAAVTMVAVDPIKGYYWSLIGDTIIFNGGLIEYDRISITTFNQDLSYKFTIEEFAGDAAARYLLSGLPSNDSTLIVTVNGQVQRMLWDFALVKADSAGYEVNQYDVDSFETGLLDRYFVVFNPGANHTPADTIVVRYMRGKTERPGTAFRQFTSSTGNKVSQVLSNETRTRILNAVTVNTSEIEIEDIRVVTPPTLVEPGKVWIGNELIEFNDIRPAPSIGYPHRGFLIDILRGVEGTSSSPSSFYTTIFYDGDGERQYFATPTAIPIENESVKVNDKLQVGGAIEWYTFDGTSNIAVTITPILGADSIRVRKLDLVGNPGQQLDVGTDFIILGPNVIQLSYLPTSGSTISIELDLNVGVQSQYYIGVNPPTTAPGRYVVFPETNIPPIGYKNVAVSVLTISATVDAICHLSGTLVQDAGTKTIIPGGYSWEAAPSGLQYNTSYMAKFLLDHPGTVS